MSSTQYVSYANAQTLFGRIGERFSALTGAYTVRGNVTFANLPATITSAMSGYVYNVTDDFTTDARFVEGAGKDYPANTNVVVADLSTYDAVTPKTGDNPSTEGWYEIVSGAYVLSLDEEVVDGKTYYAKTTNVKFDVLGGFVDVAGLEAAIDAVAAMITGAFDDATAYDAGDIVTYNGGLYKFDEAHAAGDWVGTDATATTVIALLNAVNAALTARVNKIDNAIGDAFDATEAYEAGDLVIYDDTVYRFTDDKAAGAWDSTKVEAVTVLDLIDNAEPDSLTTEQVNALLRLIG